MQQERSAKRRERILDAAFSVFSQRGYRGAGVDEVGRGALAVEGHDLSVGYPDPLDLDTGEAEDYGDIYGKDGG